MTGRTLEEELHFLQGRVDVLQGLLLVVASSPPKNPLHRAELQSAVRDALTLPADRQSGFNPHYVAGWNMAHDLVLQSLAEIWQLEMDSSP